jgi:hypothetical protein
MKRINGKTFLRSDISSLKEKEQIHKILVRTMKKQQKRKLNYNRQIY